MPAPHLKIKIRDYGWFCTNCRKHKDFANVDVAKIVGSKYMTIICSDCSTELVDCFVVHKDNINCNQCPDRFKCFTRADAVSEKGMRSLRSHEVKTTPEVTNIMKDIQGIRSYTGVYNDKLEGALCDHQSREDCNHSWMRSNYQGIPYSRCENMKYEIKEKRWYCLRGK